MHSYRGLSPKAALVTFLVDRSGTDIASADLEAIRAARARVLPDNRLVRSLTGAIDRTVAITDGSLPARDGYDIPTRTYRPAGSPRDRLPVVMWFHGGGWVLGRPAAYDPLCTHIAAQVGAVVVSVDYRLAPEHRAPTAVHDVVDATVAVHRGAAGPGTDPTRMAVAGDSAGGNLSAVVAQVLRDEGIDALKHQALIYPATDLTRSSPSIREHANAPILDAAAVDAFIGHYLGPGADARDPLVSPLYGTLEGLPPALVQTADVDPIRDDGLRYARALEDAGVPVRLTNYLRVPHGFASMPYATPVGAMQRAELVAELSRALRR